jgi:hypothetical protein
MDNICVKTAEYRQLQHIAKLTTSQIFEVDLYIALAMSVEQYMNEPSSQLLTQIEQELDTCKQHFPMFNQQRQMLVHTLLEAQYLLMDENHSDIPTQKNNEIPLKQDVDNNSNSKDNVVNIFTKKQPKD